ncbi:gliding motility-associated C-terminal domain-containing protein [Tenacibaculum finnmarkense]|uniref:T9SS type B sorting domain-containing protein n=1 Tax=Tenacibaculum finnmarkense TaxID=2781243 RepID=UPI001EFBE4E3|nr:gliding motility-associated C-terminal domain-containing protein [Tenacibaculum finnmarkense]MCG8208225.1 gliding motility-associated C-terminal domain-containing protein [Tenacibaculum finnmarkense genomovar finnmarkense]MCG8724184.1 T9SS type B sorting domain-containing protein [Tenacibaculum finnmarkense]MCG8742530.1 T9SS type B sorting domain-containing protein [Tenacibaculum finnmarkense]MCG8765939.1 T9SS type B sorting domain-containing protein [Tenacibaculum finnmarkense]MCG8778873.1
MSAQNVSIGGGGSASDNSVINIRKSNNYSQIIYLGSEIKQSGKIENLTFKLNTTGNVDISTFRNWTVRLKLISRRTSEFDYNRGQTVKKFSGFTEVFYGSIQYDRNTGYVKIPFNTAFNYDKNKNLVVEITENTPGAMYKQWYDKTPYPKFKIFWPGVNRFGYRTAYNNITHDQIMYGLLKETFVPQVIIGFKAVVNTPPVKASELHSTLSVDKPVIGSNNKEIATITVVLKDKDGKKLNKSGGKLSFSPTGVSNITDNGDGTYTAKFKTNTPDDYSFTATITSADKTKVTIKTPANIKATKVMEVTVGTGGCGQSVQSNSPAKYDEGLYNGGKKNSWSLMLYKASDLNNLAGKLTTIGFYTDCKNKTYKRAKKQRVYVKEVSENEITNNSHPDLSTFTKVFDGEYTWKSGASFDTSRSDITLTEDFVYSGTKNLVVYYENESGIAMGMFSSISFLWDNKGENRVAYAGYKNNSKKTTKGTISKELPITYFKFSPAPIAIQPVISMQNPAEASICENNSFTFSDVSVTENPNLKWTTDGTGLFEDDAKLLSKYTPSDQDATKGFVTLSLTAKKGKLSDTKTFKLNIQADAKSAGLDGTLTVCSGINPTVKQLFKALKGNPEAGGTWTSKDFVHTYTQTTDLGCNNKSASVTITIQDDAKSAGLNGTLTVCKGKNPTNDDLFKALKGNPEVGGTWSENGLVHTYTQTTDLGCNNKSASVTITIQDDAKSAGLDGTLTVCKGTNPTNNDLFKALKGNPEAGGTWTSKDFVHTYTQTTDLGCNNKSASVTVDEESDAKSAGLDGVLTICKGTNPTNNDLFKALKGNPELGGTWTSKDFVHTYTQTTDLGCNNKSASVTVDEESDAKSAGLNGTLTVCKGTNPTNNDLFEALKGNPELGGTWAKNGLVHTYTQTTDLGCKENSASVTITIQDDAKSAGLDGTLTVCKGTNPTNNDLFKALKGNPELGGTWTSNGLVHTYTQTTDLGCNNKSASVTITIQDDAKSAGLDGTLTVCKGINPTNDELFEALKGNPEVGGTWTSNGLVHTYTQTTDLGCNNKSASVTITIQDDAKSAGLNGTLTVCKGKNPTNDDLFKALKGNPEVGGTWASNGLVHTYTQTTDLGCKENSASVTITIQDEAKSAGLDGVLTICKGTNPTNNDLFKALKGNPEAGGTWTSKDFVHTYTQTTDLGCNNKSASVTITIQDEAKSAGLDGTLTVCSGINPTNDELFEALKGNPEVGGTWAKNGLVHTYTQTTDLGCKENSASVTITIQDEAKSAGLDGTLTVCSGINPTNDELFAALKGNPELGGTWAENGLVHTYTQTTNLGCNNKSASVTVDEESDAKSAGLDGTLTVCKGTNPTNDDLFKALKGNPELGGTWTSKDFVHTYTQTTDLGCNNKSASVTITIQDDAKSAGLDGTLTVCKGTNPTEKQLFKALKGNPELGGTWTSKDFVHTYTQTTDLGCNNKSASVTITIQDDAKSAGLDGTLTVCKGTNPTNNDLFKALKGNPELGGTWTSKDFVHTYTQTTDLGCNNKSASVTVDEESEAKSAGLDGTLTVCKGINPTNDELFAALKGNPELGGTWAENGLVHTYTQTTNLGCNNKSASVTITIQDDAKSAGLNGTLTVCKGINPTNDELFEALKGNPELGGTWTSNGLVHTYTQTTYLGCNPKSASVTVDEDTAKNAGENGMLTVCKGTVLTEKQLFDALEGSPDLGGTWTSNGLVYTYTQVASLGCNPNFSRVVVMEQSEAKSAGLDGTLTVCKGVNPTGKQLFDALGGSPETGGTWRNNGSVHTYTQTTSLGCNPKKATIIVNEESEVKSAGLDGVLSILDGTEPTEDDLFAALEGFPDMDGSWAENNSNTYTYTVTSTSPCTKNKTATIRIKRNQEVANGFSPNGDGVNDTWIVLPDVANKYPKNIMRIYNRHGNLVYKALTYNNNWDGTSNGKITINKESKLPVGSYVYILELNNATKKVLKGWVYINY